MERKIGQYILYLADSSLVLSHRLSEICGHGPFLEEDIAITNIAIDLLGHARLFYDYADVLLGKNEDELVYFREEIDFCNMALVELPNKDYAHTIFRLYSYSVYYYLLLKELADVKDETLAIIAKKIIIEVASHKTHSKRWIDIFI